MKRCPQCEFIYEDDQSLCDMDGILLVLDSRTLPNHHALATVPPSAKTQRRHRAVPAFATLILALVLGMVYYVSTRTPGYTPEPAPSTLSAAPVTIPTPQPQPSAEPTPAAVETKPATVKEPATPPASAKKSAAKTTWSPSKAKPTPAPKKDESKVNSILKKTGRILKKPFKF